MSPRSLTARLGAVFVSAAALVAAVAPAGQAEQADNARSVVVANAKVRVVKTEAGALVAESLTNGRRTTLGRHVPAGLVDVDGSSVGYARRFSNRVGVISIDARTGKVRRSSAAENVLALQVRRTGTLVWITQHGTSRSVHARTFPADVVLGTGSKIDPRSLAIADSTAATARVYWVDGRTPHVAAVE